MRRAWPWIAASALVVAAGALTVLTPAEDALTDPILVRGGMNETVTSRTLSVEVTGAQFADRVVEADTSWEAEGNWLVVDITASAPRSEDEATVRLVTLELDGRVFQASERPAETLLQSRLHVGTPIEGSVAFELPAGLRGGTGVLRVSTSSPTPLLDDVVAISVPLDEATASPELELTAPDWATS